MRTTTIESRAVVRTLAPRKFLGAIASALLLSVGLGLSNAAWADFELTGPDGRRFLLKDDGTWRSLEANDKDPAQPKGQPEEAAVVRLEQKIERGNHCRLVLTLANNLPYEIRHIVPYLSAYRANGVVHETVSVAFQSIRSSDKVERTADFTRITCPEIARVQVSGGERCEMGELHKFSEAKGQCLARLRVVSSDLIRFDK